MSSQFRLVLLCVMCYSGFANAMHGRIIIWDSSVSGASIARELVAGLSFNASNVSLQNQSTSTLHMVHNCLSSQIELLTDRLRESGSHESDKLHANIIRLRKLDESVCRHIKNRSR